MQTYTLPQPCLDLLVEAMGDKKKAENLAKVMESIIGAIDDEKAKAFVEKMGTYTLPRQAFDSLLEAFGDRRTVEIFAKVIEYAVNAKAGREFVEKRA